jgi:hemerythrin-like domain-containing protein
MRTPRTLDAVGMLVAQHVELAELFERIAEAESVRLRASVFQDLADELAIHVALEEQIFYPAVKATRTDELPDTSYDHHAEMRRALAALRGRRVDDPSWIDEVSHLRALVEDHVRTEEREVFPTALRSLDRERSEALGEEMLELTVRLLQSGHPGQEVRV